MTLELIAKTIGVIAVAGILLLSALCIWVNRTLKDDDQ